MLFDLIFFFFFFLMIHFWVRCQGLGRRRLYFFLDWMNLKEPAEFLEIIHFSLCLRVSFKNRAVCCGDSRVLPWRAVRLATGLWALWFLARELLKLVVTGCQLLLWEELPGFPGCCANCLAVHCSDRAPLQPPRLCCHALPKQLCSTTGAIPGVHACRVPTPWHNFLSFLLSLDPL